MKKVADKKDVKVGDEVTYTLIAENKGNGVWTDVIKDALPKEVEYVANSTTANGKPVKDADAWKTTTVLNHQTTIAPKQKLEIKFKVKVLASAKGQTITNIAVAGDEPTPPADIEVADDNGKLTNNGTKNHRLLVYLGVVVSLLPSYMFMNRFRRDQN